LGIPSRAEKCGLFRGPLFGDCPNPAAERQAQRRPNFSEETHCEIAGIGNCIRVTAAPPGIQERSKVIVDHAAFEDAETRLLKRRPDLRARESPMMAVIGFRLRARVEK
jgi:hypothetical protein